MDHPLPSMYFRPWFCLKSLLLSLLLVAVLAAGTLRVDRTTRGKPWCVRVENASLSVGKSWGELVSVLFHRRLWGCYKFR